MTCRDHDARSSLQVGHTERYQWCNRRLWIIPDRDLLRNEGICRQLGKFVGVITCIMANDYPVRCDSGMFVPDILGQTLRCLDNGQGIHARESCGHPATQTGCTELDSYGFSLEAD